jgi:hypothetical protein
MTWLLTYWYYQRSTFLRITEAAEMPEKRRRSFYANVLDEAERQELRAAAAVQDIDEEIAVMRVRIKSLVKSEDIEALTRCMNTLARLVATHFNVTKHEKRGIKEAMTNVLRDVALPLGIVLGDKFMK